MIGLVLLLAGLMSGRIELFIVACEMLTTGAGLIDGWIVWYCF